MDDLIKKSGGSAWESNPPGTVLAPHTGFEVREPHQWAAHFRYIDFAYHIAILYFVNIFQTAMIASIIYVSQENNGK